MTKTTFTPGNKFENLASSGYIWEIVSIKGETVNMESKGEDKQIAKASMLAKDLQAMIDSNYFQSVKD